jgi:hypothetical protein
MYSLPFGVQSANDRDEDEDGGAGTSHIGGQTSADFFKSLHDSAKSASGELLHTFCRFLFMKYTLFADFLQTFM